MNKIFSISKTLLVIGLTSMMLITGCKKSNDADPGSGSGDDYYLKFKADGTQKEFKSQALIALQAKKDNLYSAVLQGYKDFEGQGAKDELGMIVMSNHEIVQGSSFQDPQKSTDKDGMPIPKLIMNFNDPSNNGYLSMGTLADENGTVLLFPEVVADAKLTISELTSKYAKGTFSGTVYLSTDANLKTKIKITEGEFYLKRIQ
jgi:hypothetical protein